MDGVCHFAAITALSDRLVLSLQFWKDARGLSQTKGRASTMTDCMYVCHRATSYTMERYCVLVLHVLREEKCYASEARTIRVVKTESTYRLDWVGILNNDSTRLNTFRFDWDSPAQWVWRDLPADRWNPLPTAGLIEQFSGSI